MKQVSTTEEFHEVSQYNQEFHEVSELPTKFQCTFLLKVYRMIW